LPFVVALVVPFLEVARWSPFGIRYASKLPHLQMPIGLILLCLGLLLLCVTIRLFIRVGRGTLAPWDPTNNLVVEGVYAYVRNPMISGVSFMVLGESILLGSLWVFVWFVVVIVVNTIYFQLSEEPGLLERFGEDYQEYRSNVPMWIPRLRPWRPSESSKNSK